MKAKEASRVVHCAGFSWRLKPERAVNLFRTIVRPVLDYAPASTLLMPKYLGNRIALIAASQVKKYWGLTKSSPHHESGESQHKFRKTLLARKELIRFKRSAPFSNSFVRSNPMGKNCLSENYKNFKQASNNLNCYEEDGRVGKPSGLEWWV